jgi:hypothetical protein
MDGSNNKIIRNPVMQWHVNIMAGHQMTGMGLVKMKPLKLLCIHDSPLNMNGTLLMSFHGLHK